ncbi:hypothetical protein K461DRAFT_289905 [Myriangium duriaei CBS 260.36]|uniref:Malate dehydrogenase n=1 Tax=Myriangium duriaei CBS 260.36 TaxID=1168546 RepID=A0A9P4MLS6_9PEZI|nr:hypothetical protein K461DRAFT_289905 [Myriangium duriaei CBS 260.36]
MRSLLLLAFCFTLLVAAGPISYGTQTGTKTLQSELKEVIEYAVEVSDSKYAKCNPSNAELPQAPTPLPSPSSGLRLAHIAIGRGTQNYTCNTGNSTAAPVAGGALASLFNVTCLVIDSPALISNLTQIALDLPIPFTPEVDDAAEGFYGYSGEHFFLDTTTPFFNLDTATHQYGTGAFKKAAASNPPTGSTVGPNGQGNGAVPWLKLTAAPGYGVQKLMEVYRVQTAGGSAPKTCAGQDKNIYVPYSAEYWFYA